MSLTKRRIVALTLLFAAGVIASFLFAWIVAAWSGPGYDGRCCTDVLTAAPGQPVVTSTRIVTLGHEEWQRIPGDFWASNPDLRVYPREMPAPSWAPPPDSTTSLDRCSAAYGFPMFCLRNEFGFDQSGARWDRYSITLNRSARSAPLPGPSTPSPVALPLDPMWLGFLVDSLFFAALFGLSWLAVVLIRRIRRYRLGRARMGRGCCPACNYDLIFDYTRPCPECGHGFALGAAIAGGVS
jgi:hypothetical protein